MYSFEHGSRESTLQKDGNSLSHLCPSKSQGNYSLLRRNHKKFYEVMKVFFSNSRESNLYRDGNSLSHFCPSKSQVNYSLLRRNHNKFLEVMKAFLTKA